MKRILGTLVSILVFVATGCGDGNGVKIPPGSGGSTAGSGGESGAGGGSPDGSGGIAAGSGGTLGTGGVAIGSGGSGGSSAGGSGSGGSSKTGAGGSNSDAGPEKADAPAANADQAVPQGDAAGDNYCPAFEPCGGSVVGTWYLTFQCIPSLDASSCYGGYRAEFDRASTTVVTYNADGTMKSSVPDRIRIMMRYPVVCVGGDAGAAQACSYLEAQVQESLPGIVDAGTSTPTVESFTCEVESNQVCLCSEDVRVGAVTTSGTYSVSGNQISGSGLTVTPMPDGGIGDAGAGEPAEYCVSGNTLRFLMSTGSRYAVVTLTK
jgi:hypothetical protein